MNDAFDGALGPEMLDIDRCRDVISAFAIGTFAMKQLFECVAHIVALVGSESEARAAGNRKKVPAGAG